MDSGFAQTLQNVMNSEESAISGGSGLTDVDELRNYFAPVPNPLLFRNIDQYASLPSIVEGTGIQSSFTDMPVNIMPSVVNQVSALSMEYFQNGSTVSTEFNALIEQAGRKHGVDVSLIKAVIRTESSFNPNVVSSAGAKGLMQLMDGTASSLGVRDSYDPSQNIEGGTQYLADLLRKYDGNEAVAIAAYNCGPGRMDRLGISTNGELYANYDKLPRETQRYVEKVLKAREQYMI
ncbi:hypothetical protein SY83_14865 [Paenibacillus swuensis]|uniref:Transglycosylase SLT domain-containing protein n=2 Tax=Paenibacillus swuensis TaxID=1178515 RepID=A0A172TQA3_9BACL|nr:hypothetical protein SY83_14865 [Paenibacillus swuensis]